MKSPPVEWDDLLSFGVSPAATISTNGDSVTVEPRPNRLVVRLLSLLASSPPPDPDVDRVGYLRAIRDALMLCTDWTQMGDSPLTAEQRAAWASYRQALRDLPDAYSGTGPIPWPKEPA